MTYLDFHLVFTLPLLVLCLFVNRKNPDSWSKKSFYATALLCFLAMSYTTPWDSYLIREQIWTYEAGRVLGTFLHIPFEEYFFFLIQTVIGCLFTAFLLKKTSLTQTHPLNIKQGQILAIAIGASLFGALALLTQPENHWRYLWLVAIWALPIVSLQLLLGHQVLLQKRKVWLGGTLLLFSYFCLADAFAIAKNIWVFPEKSISGLQFLGLLPIEEALFFLATNLMVVQGYILFVSFDFKLKSSTQNA